MTPRLLLAVTHPMTVQVLLDGQVSMLREAGFEVGLAVGAGPGLDGVSDLEGAAVFRLSMERGPSPASDLQSLVAMTRVLRQFRPDIVNASTPKAGLLGMVAAAWARTPVRVYTVRGLPQETARGVLRATLQGTETVAAKCAHRVICVSESLRAKVVGLGMVSAKKAEVLGPGSSNGVDENRFRPCGAQEKREARHALGIPGEAPVIGFVGRLTQDKGLVDLADVFCEYVLSQLPECRLLLLGDFENRDSVPTDVRRRLEQHPNVVRIGFSSEPELAFRAMEVLALPSYREGFPNAPLEASASSVPVVAYAATGSVDAVDDGVTGTLVAVGDVRGMATALMRYLEDRDLRAAHGRRGRERAVRDFRRELVWERWVEFYRTLLVERDSG